MKGNGSISIFSSCILMILIVFCGTIVDTTRIHIAKGQSNRALAIANHSILANYDSHLAKQYGIFGVDFSSNYSIENEITSYMESSLNPEKDNLKASLVSQIINYSNKKYFKMYDYKINEVNINDKKSLINPDYIRLQILEFMKYRAPLTPLTSFIEKLEVIKKASKTTQIIKQKNELVEEIDEIQKDYYELEKLIDGLIFETKSGDMSYDRNGKLRLFDNYVKKIVTEDSYSQPLYNIKEIPDNACMERLNENLLFIDEHIKLYQEAVDICETEVKNIANYITREKELIKEKEKIKDEIRRLRRIVPDDEEEEEEIEEEIDDLEDELDEIEEEIEEINDKIDKSGSNFNKYYRDIYEIYKNEIKNLTDNTYDELYGIYGLLGVHERALNIINNMKKEVAKVESSIDDFKKVLKNEGDEYIDTTCQNINKEVENYEKILGLDEKDNEIVNNLNEIEKVLISNKDVLYNIKTEVSLIVGSEKDVSTSWLKKATSDEEIIKEIVSRKNSKRKKLLNIKYNRDLTTSLNNNKIINVLNELENKLDNYSRKVYFDYSNMNLKTKEGFDYESYKDSNKKKFDEISLPLIGTSIPDIESLPSLVYFSQDMSNENEDDVSELEMDTETSNNMLEKLSSVGEGLENLGVNLRNELYINEYIIGMFRAATDIIDEEIHDIVDSDVSSSSNKVDDDGPLTLNNYPMSEHFMNYEVEYILYGKKDDLANLTATVGTIFGIRIAFNILHILSNADKLNRINTAATAIAGWWTLGIGSIVIAAVLTLIWAIVESVNDVTTLLAGQDVPIIKTVDTWETDILGGIINTSEKVIEETSNTKVDKKKSISDFIPSLDYKGYLRLLLFSGIVDDDVKMMRVLDLIQLNISSEREEYIFLENYVSAFSSSTEVEVNYLFLPLKFMPEKAHDLGNYFKLKAYSSVTY